MRYHIYQNHYGAKFNLVGCSVNGQVDVMGLKTCRIYTYNKVDFKKNFSYVGSQPGHPLIYGVMCDKGVAQ